MARVILASSSPRRKELLSEIVDDFDIRPADIDEAVLVGESAWDYVVRMANTKALAIAQGVSGFGFVIGVDTIGVVDGEILTKPTDKAHAWAMWDKLSDNTHQILTAVCICIVKDRQIIRQKAITVATDVQFVCLTEAQKERYWATGEPLDKAGAYAIQGGAMSWVRAINGSYTSVVGLPLAQTHELLAQMMDEICP